VRLLQYRPDRVRAVGAPYLFVMTRNAARRFLARQRRDAHGQAAAPQLSGSLPAAGDEPDLVRALMNALAPRQREAVELTAGRGLSDRQAGLALSTSGSAVCERRRIGLEQLRRKTAGRDEDRRA
jgi:DNA-directed RNA polymerase specialized sigma24 family protein